MTFYNWLTNSQQCKSREELGTKPPHNCLVGCSYLARGGKNQISSLQTRLHSLPSFSQIMQEYWQPGRTGMPTETHGIARSAVVPCSLTTFHGDKVSYIFNLPCPFCLLKKSICTLISYCWHLQMFLCSGKLYQFMLKLSADVHHFACQTFALCQHSN